MKKKSKSWAQQMYDQGIMQVEVTATELLQMFQDGKISFNQYRDILLDGMSLKDLNKILRKSIPENWDHE